MIQKMEYYITMRFLFLCSNKMVSAKSKSKMPQKTKTKCHKKQKQIATKNKNYLAVSFILSIFAHKIV